MVCETTITELKESVKGYEAINAKRWTCKWITGICTVAMGFGGGMVSIYTKTEDPALFAVGVTLLALGGIIQIGSVLFE